MPRLGLSDVESNVAAQGRDLLGHDITYTPDGDAALTIRAQVDYGDGTINTAYSAGIDNEIEMQVVKTDLASPPASKDRVVTPKIPGKIFRPVNVETSEDGLHWLFNLKLAP